LFDTIETLLIGTAAIVDTVLLLLVFERKNRGAVRLPARLLVLAAWLWHVAAFVHLALLPLEDAWSAAAGWLVSSVMALGLLAIPCALLHGTLALVGARLPRAATGLLYVPCLFVVPIAVWFAEDPSRLFVEQVGAWIQGYGLVLAAIEVASGVVSWRARAGTDSETLASFLGRAGRLMIGLGVLLGVVFAVLLPAFPAAEQELMLVAAITPVVPALLFVYFVVRHFFLQLVLERSLVYAALVLFVLLLNHAVFAASGMTGRWVLIEGIVVVALIAGYAPLRQRVAESLRYLFGERIDRVRARCREVSHELGHARASGEDLVRWFVDASRRAVDVPKAAAWLLDRDDLPAIGDDFAIDRAGVARLFARLERDGAVLATARKAETELAHDLRRAGASIAIRLDARSARGLVLFGRRSRNRELPDEIVAALLLLVEQLAGALDGRSFEAGRIAAERRVLQSEKLSMIGLITSSIAHEIKNPLSSIKTLTTVLLEDLDDDHARAEDLRMIQSEVDRLSQITGQLLSFARPENGGSGPARLGDVVRAVYRFMRHHARQRRVDLGLVCSEDLPEVAARPEALHEILFNLISNAIEAAGEGGRVAVETARLGTMAVIAVSDTGPGIPEDIRDRLFEPFVTTKPQGTGLGLWVVWRRVEELGGQITCTSPPGGGSKIRVELPVEAGP